MHVGSVICFTSTERGGFYVRVCGRGVHRKSVGHLLGSCQYVSIIFDECDLKIMNVIYLVMHGMVFGVKVFGSDCANHGD